MLVGGFPCQDYSVAKTLNLAKGLEGKRGVLWWEIHRIVSDKKPKYLLLENVDRLLKSPATQRGRDFAIMLASLSDLGYTVEWRVINAADYGMPQRRRRVFIFAFHDSTDLNKSFSNVARVDWLATSGILARAFPVMPIAEDHLFELELQGDLSEITEEFNTKKSDSPFGNGGVISNRRVYTHAVVPSYHGDRKTLKDVVLMNGDVPSEYYIDENDLKKWLYLKGPKNETRVKKNTGFTYSYNEGGMSFPDPLDKPSRTIITAEGGTSASRFKHVIQTPEGRYRRLTPLELERLNMFPDDHTKGISDVKRAFLMGNALVVGIVERIGRSLSDEVTRRPSLRPHK